MSKSAFLSISFCFFLMCICKMSAASGLHEHENSHRFRASVDQCESVDIRQYQNQAAARFFYTPKIQSDSNWCYAYAGADLLTDIYQQPISAVGMALFYNSKLNRFDEFWRKVNSVFDGSNQEVPDGGLLDELMQQNSSETPVCLEEEVPSSQFTGKSFKDYGVGLKRLWSNERFTEMAGQLKKLFPRRSVTEIVKALQDFSEEDFSFSEVMGQLLQRFCSKGMGAARFTWQTTYKYFSDPAEAVAESLSLSRPRPVAILLDSGYLYKSDKVGLLSRWIGDHYVSVVARKWSVSKKQCEYLVRDSFGTDCDQYKSSIRCDGKGNFWLTEWQLSEYAVSATYLSP